MTLAALSFRAIWVIVCAKIRSEINPTYLLTETSRSRLLCLVGKFGDLHRRAEAHQSRNSESG